MAKWHNTPIQSIRLVAALIALGLGVALVLVLSRTLALAAPPEPYMVKDIYAWGNSSNPLNLTNVSGTLFFVADDGIHGKELWKSDGTVTGTVMVKDIYPGPSSAHPSELVDVDGTLYFGAYDGIRGDELWKSDGTVTGTVMVRDINTGTWGSQVSGLTNVSGTLYFGAYDGTRGSELWKSDGTIAGTVVVKDIYTGISGSNPGWSQTSMNGLFFFVADDGIHGWELWALAPSGLALYKAATPHIAAPGQTITYTITYINRGDQVASGVLITDVVPITVTQVSYTYAGATLTPTGNISYTWQAADLDPGGGGAITITGIVSPAATGVSILINQATITTTDPGYTDADLGDNVSTARTTTDAVPPLAPRLLAPVDDALISDTDPTLAWQPSASSDATGYWLDWNGTVTDAGNVTQYSVTVSADGTYTLTVAAYDQVGNTSPFTNIWSFTLDTTPPTPPKLLSPADGAIVSDTNVLTLGWGASLDATGYLLKLDGVISDVGPITQTTTGILTDAVYTWTVAAYDSLGNTSASTDIWSCTVPAAPPEAPTLLTPADNARLTDTTPTLTWTSSPSPNVNGYVLDWNGTKADVGNVTAYTTTALADGVYTWTVAAYDTFYTGPYADVRSLTVDTTLPRISGTSPISSALGVEISAPVIITFSEAISAGTFAYTAAPDPGGWAKSWDSTKSIVTLTHNTYDGETIYTVTVTTAADLAGNPLSGAPYQWQFTTADLTPPQVLAVSPASGATAVDVTAPIVITFSEPISTSTLVYDVTPDPGGWAESWDSTKSIVTLTHNTYDGETIYTVTVTTAADLAGNPLSGAPYQWQFTTADLTPPQVLAVSPTSGATAVDVTAPIVITFSEPISTSTLVYNLTPDPGGWATSWDDIGSIVTLTHHPFDCAAAYTATVAAAADLSGNPLPSTPHAWHFTAEPCDVYLPLILRNLVQ